MSLKNSNDIIGNRTRDLPVCTVVPQRLRHRAPQRRAIGSSSNSNNSNNNNNNNNVPDLLVILPHHREYRGGWRQQERYVNSRLEKSASFIVIESLEVPPEHKHLTHVRCFDSAERFALITFFLSSINHVLPKF